MIKDIPDIASALKEDAAGGMCFYVTESVSAKDAIVALIIHRMSQSGRTVIPEYARILCQMNGYHLLTVLAEWSSISQLADKELWADLQYQAKKLEECGYTRMLPID